MLLMEYKTCGFVSILLFILIEFFKFYNPKRGVLRHITPFFKRGISFIRLLPCWSEHARVTSLNDMTRIIHIVSDTKKV